MPIKQKPMDDISIWVNSEYTFFGDTAVRTLKDAKKVMGNFLELGKPLVVQFQGEVKVDVVILEGVTDTFAYGRIKNVGSGDTKSPVTISYSDIISYAVKITVDGVPTGRVPSTEVFD